MVKYKFRAVGWQDNLNLIVYFSIILSGIGITWLALNEVPAGIRYITIFLVSVAFLFVSFFFINEDQKEEAMKIIKNPFEVDYDVASGLYILGWLIPIILYFILKAVGSAFVISQLMVPLSAGSVLQEIQTQSFAIAETQADPFWQWFITVFTAGSIEEFAFGFVLMLVGTLIGMMIWRLAVGKDTVKARWFYITVALIFTGLIFGGAHKLNASYVGIMFLIAIGFRLVMNYSIYVLGVFLSFTLGYHQSNNAVWFYTNYGSAATFQALTSIGGIAILIYFTLIIFYAIKNLPTIIEKIPKVLTQKG